MKLKDKKRLNELLTKLNCKLTKPEYYPHDQSYQIHCEPPKDKMFEDGCNSYVVIWFSYIKGSKDEAMLDLIDRLESAELVDYIEE
jgi:hypothetical protein